MDGVSRVVGTCETMCPVEEFKMRQREGLLHSLELPQGRKPVGRGRARLRGEISCAVKEYSRPAAGRSDPVPNTLRPPRVLHQTINYLFNNLIAKHHTQEPGWNIIYDFVFDRLRAVRQDMVIQGISGEDAIIILEACVRFHVYAAYRLCEHKMDTFDPVINFQHTQECLKRLLYLYKQTDTGQTDNTYMTDQRNKKSCRCSSSDSSNRRRHLVQDSSGCASDSLENKLGDMHISKDSRQNAESETDSDADSEDHGGRLGWKSRTCHADCCSCFTDRHRNRAEFESIYLLCNLGDSDALRHFLNLPKFIRCEKLPALAYKMSISYLLGNTLRVVRLASRLTSDLALCAFHRHLASVQMHGFKIMCTAYSSKNTRFPLSKLTQLLAFDSEVVTEQMCTDSGLEVRDGKVSFLKSTFRAQEKTNPVRWEYLEGRLSSVCVSDLLLGQTG